MDKEDARKPKSVKAKKCCICKEKFIPRRAMQSACSYPATCEAIKAERLIEKEVARREKVARRQVAERREAIKTLPELLKRCQTDFNALVNVMDAGLTCIACNEPINGVAHASHYLSVGARPNLRFDKRNCHRGCSKCNMHLHGNLINYRINLIEKIGLEEVEALEADHTPKNYTREQISDMATHYRKLKRELLK